MKHELYRASPGFCLQQGTDVESSSYLLGKEEILHAVKEEELQRSGSCIYSSWTLPESSSCVVTVGAAVMLMGGMFCLPIISLLEEQCLRIFSRQDTHGSPPLVQVVPQHIPNSQPYTPVLLGGNEIQRDPGYPRDRDVRPPPDPATSPTKSPFRVPPLALINEGE